MSLYFFKKHFKTFILIFFVEVLTLKLNAQLTPPPQDFILGFNNSIAVAPADNKLKLQGEFSMMCWIYPTKHEPYSIIMGKPALIRDNDPYMTYVIEWGSAGDKIEFAQTTGASGSYRTATSSVVTPLNEWTHVAATLGSGIMKLFINGVEVASSASPGLPQQNQVPFSIGGGINNSNFCCPSNLIVKQAGIWGRALNATEIKNSAENIPTISEPDLIAFWKMDEGQGQVLKDISPNKLDLTLGMTSNIDSNDPQWLDNFLFSLEPFFKQHSNTISLINDIEDFYPFDTNNDGVDEYLTSSIKFPPDAPPGAFRPIEVLKVNTDLSVINATSTIIPGGIQMVHPRDMRSADFNNDGRKDLIIIGHGTDIPPFPGEQSKILIQQSDGSFKDETAERLPVALDFTHHVSIADIDKDGDNDLYMCNIGGGPATSGPRFYMNDGSGFFTIGSGRLPQDIATRNVNNFFTSSVLYDFDADGDADLFLGGNEFGVGYVLLLNDGTGHFSQKQNAVDNKKPGYDWITVALCILDADDDGDMDLICSNTPGNPFYAGAALDLLLNDGHAKFTNASERIKANFSTAGWVKWMQAVDLNNDGIQDLLLSSNGSVNNSLLLAQGNGRYIQTNIKLPPSNGPIRAGDFDKDGDNDLITVLGSTAYIGENISSYENSKASLNKYGIIKICPNDNINVELSAKPQDGSTYQWLKDGVALPGESFENYTALSEGLYRLIVKHGLYPADTSLTAQIVYANVPQPLISRTGNVLTSSDGIAYKWFKDDNILATTTKSVSVTETGLYKVEMTNSDGCISVSDPFEVSLISNINQNFFENNLNIFPNPTEGEVFIELARTSEKVFLKIFDMTGREVKNGEIDASTDSAIKFDLSELKNSLYLLEITSQGSTIYKKISKI